jgi:hypothetical protein
MCADLRAEDLHQQFAAAVGDEVVFGEAWRVLLTRLSTLTMRLTRARSPAAACSVPSRSMATARAAALPSSVAIVSAQLAHPGLAGLFGDVAREKTIVAGAHKGHIGGGRNGHGRQHDAQGCRRSLTVMGASGVGGAWTAPQGVNTAEGRSYTGPHVNTARVSPALRWVLPALGVLAGTAAQLQQAGTVAGAGEAGGPWPCWPRLLLAWGWCWRERWAGACLLALACGRAGLCSGPWRAALAPGRIAGTRAGRAGLVGHRRDQRPAAQYAHRHTLCAGRGGGLARCAAGAGAAAPVAGLVPRRGRGRAAGRPGRRPARRPALALAGAAAPAAWQLQPARLRPGAVAVRAEASAPVGMCARGLVPPRSCWPTSGRPWWALDRLRQDIRDAITLRVADPAVPPACWRR